MNHQERQFAYRIKSALDANLHKLPATTTDRLAAARRVALARKKKTVPMHARAPQFVLSPATQKQASTPGSWLKRFGVALPLLVGILLLTGLYQQEAQQRIRTLAEIDASVLSDELPPSAYLDRGFHAYLTKQDLE